MKDKIYSTFKHLGFEMENFETLGYSFEYEGINYMWMDDNDEEFLNIAIPAVLDKSDIDEVKFYQVINKLNSTLKYVKANEIRNKMWLFYERELIGEEDLEKLLPKMILHLEHAFRFLSNGREDADNNDSMSINENYGEGRGYIIDDIEILSDND